ncbi:YciI-like protein [Novosphingobium sp. M1R2S20]|uniref:YciI-like protein n=1 Tax=Novosphingobium rhizovicinum TaxID=3228928 RepID=A0ABV3R8M3_9SPHN
MAHWLLTYDLAPDYLDRRPAFRDEHLTLAREAAARGDLLLGGALDPPEQAMLLFQGDTPAAAEGFAAADPYVANGLIARWTVRQWITVVGKGAASPL